MDRSGEPVGSRELDAAVAACLSSLRRARGVSQEVLGEELGHDQSFVSKVEHGHRRVTVSEGLRWAAALGMSLDELLAALVPLWSEHLETSSIWEREE
jgi:transcriptional regulator with XRE-family HTH domain